MNKSLCYLFLLLFAAIVSPSIAFTKNATGKQTKPFHLTTKRANYKSVNITASTAPTISSFTPLAGTIGSTITITGTNFSNTAADNIVYFGGTKGIVTNASSTSLSVTVPNGVQYGPISVTTGNKTAYSTQSFDPTFSCGVALSASVFEAPMNLTVGSTPQGGTMVDIDGDEKLDLLATNFTKSFLTVFRNTATPGVLDASSFAPKVDFRTQNGAFQVGTGDLDGDGKLDVAVSAFGNDTVLSVFRNTSNAGGISFSSPSYFSTPTGLSSGCRVEIKDLDADGKPEIILAFRNKGFSIYKNNVSGSTISAASFTRQDFISSTMQANDIAVADMNMDGKPDIVVPEIAATKLHVYINQGNLAFTDNVITTSASAMWGISLADVDGDGKPDISGHFRNANKFYVIRNTSTASTFSAAAEVSYPTTGVQGIFTLASDLNGDGKPDFITGNLSPGNPVVVENLSTSGTISLGTPFKVGNTGSAIMPMVGDADGDSRPDVFYVDNISKIIGCRSNPLPMVAAITGTTTICIGANNTLATTSTGGTWNSNNTNIATVDASGKVTGIAVGTAKISYTITNTQGCSGSRSVNVTINAIPTVAAITGSSTVLTGQTTTLSNGTVGGNWSSSDLSIATVSNTGVVTGVANGTTTITYTVTANGCSASQTTTINVSTVSLATVTTTAASGITSSSAVLGGNVTADGGGIITETGIVWNTTGNPTIANNKETTGNGTGSFSKTITGLPANTTVYVKAYAVNAAGTAYGNQETFITPQAGATVSITRAGNSITNAPSVDFTVTFDKNITGLSVSNFALTSLGGISGSPAITSISGSGSTYTVNVSTGSGDGIIRLIMLNDTGIVPAILNIPYFNSREDYSMDRTAPDGNFTSTPTLITSSTSATFAFNSNEVGSAFEINLDGAGYAPATSPLSLGSLSDGNHTISLRTSDAAGNTDATPATFTWTIDTQEPTTTITVAPSAQTNSPSASFTFVSNETSATFEASLDNGPYTVITSPTVFSNLAEGNHTFKVRAKDAAGNSDQTPALHTWLIDTTKPAGTFAINNNATHTNTASVTLNLVMSDAGSGLSQMRLSNDNNTWSSWENYGTSKTWNLNNGDGQKTVYAEIQDGAGNVTALNDAIELDTNQPAITAVTVPANGTYVSGHNLDFVVTYSESVTVNTTSGIPTLGLTLGSSNVNATYMSGSGTTFLTFRYTVSPGNLDTDGIAVANLANLNGGTIKDAAGNTAFLALNSLPTTQGILIDAVIPAITSITLPANKIYKAGENLDFSVQFSENVQSTGTPAIGLTIGTATPQAAYLNGSGSTTIIFRYTVQNNDLDTDGISVASNLILNSGTIKDAAGNNATLNLTPGNTTGILIDAVVPTAPVVSSISTDTGLSSTDGITNDQTLFLNGTAEANSTVAVSLNTTLLGTTTANASGNWSYDHTATTLTAGNYTVSATATDAAGNTSVQGSTFGFTIDITAPTAPVIAAISTDSGLSNTDGITNDQTLIFSGTAEAGSKVTVSQVSTGVIGTVTANASGNWTFDYSATTLTTGAYSFTATTSDAAGNSSSNSTPFAVTVDITAPVVPVIASITDDTGLSNSDRITNDRTLVFSGTAEANSQVTISSGSTVLQTITANVTGNWTYNHTTTSLTDGVYTFMAQAKDVAGNTSSISTSFTVVIDGTAPTAPVIANISTDTGLSNSDKITSDGTLFLSGTAEANATISVMRTGSGQIGTVVANATGNWTFDYTTVTLADGNYTFTATATDIAGNISPVSTNLDVVVDGTAPNTPAVSGISIDSGVNTTDGITNDQTLFLNGTAEANSTVAVSLNTTLLGTTTANGSGNWSYDHTATTLTAGNYTVSATAADAAGNTSAQSANFSFTVDITAPNGIISSVQPNPLNVPLNLTLTFSEATDGLTASDFVVTNGVISNIQTTNNVTFTFTVTPIADGVVSVSLPANTVTDIAGNSNTATNLFSTTFDGTKPSVTLTTPAANLTNAPFTVNFTFSENVTGFAAADITVTNATISGFTAVNPTVYTALVTPLADGLVTVEVAANVALDGASNLNLASAQLTRTYDATQPTVVLTTSAANPTNVPFTVTFTFSENVSGFLIGDITIGNGTASNFTTVSPSVYTALITPAVNGTVTVEVAANMANDAATNGNIVSAQLTRIFDDVAPAGYAANFSAPLITVNNVNNTSVDVTGAEVGTTYFYAITSNNGGTPITGNAPVTTANFSIPNLNFTGLNDGLLELKFYLLDAAGNKGPDSLAHVMKYTRDIASVTTPATMQVPIRTTFAQLNLPQTVQVTYSNGTTGNIGVIWQPGNYNGAVAGPYSLTGQLVLAPATTNLNNHQANITVEVQPNKVPSALVLSNTNFEPNILPTNAIGTFSTTDADDTLHVYELVNGSGDTHNFRFEIKDDKLYLKSGNGLSGMVDFSIRVRTTDPYNNTLDKVFELNKSAYSPEVSLKIPTAFSPNGDGVNDNWIVPELRYYNNVSIEIYERSGVRIFTSADPEKGWDGRDQNGAIRSGGFFYILQIDDIKYTKKGVVTILKH